MLLLLGAPLAAGQTLSNGALDTTGPAPTAVPNDLAPDGWTALDGADLAAVGVPVDCANLLVSPSGNGGTFVKATARDVIRQGLAANVAGIVVDVPYMVRFEAASLRHFGQSSGQWAVSFAGSTINSAVLPLPAGNPAQGAWQSVSVGPFLFAGSVAGDQPIAFRAQSNADGTVLSPRLPDPPCDYPSQLAAADLLIDGIVVVADQDLDGLYTDEEATHGTSPTDSDSDDDGLADGAEIERNTDPLARDSDGDGFTDGQEVNELQTDPLNPEDPPPGTTPPQTGTTTAPGTTTTDTDAEKTEDLSFGFSSGCTNSSCATDSSPPAWLVLVGAVALVRRRSPLRRWQDRPLSGATPRTPPVRRYDRRGFR
jgi:MYXO-CTERM domain-containing protein